VWQVAETYSGEEYTRSNPIPRAQLFNARLELELEKQVAALQLVEVNLRMDPTQVPYLTYKVLYLHSRYLGIPYLCT